MQSEIFVNGGQVRPLVAAFAGRLISRSFLPFYRLHCKISVTEVIPGGCSISAHHQDMGGGGEGGGVAPLPPPAAVKVASPGGLEQI